MVASTAYCACQKENPFARSTSMFIHVVLQVNIVGYPRTRMQRDARSSTCGPVITAGFQASKACRHNKQLQAKAGTAAGRGIVAKAPPLLHRLGGTKVARNYGRAACGLACERHQQWQRCSIDVRKMQIERVRVSLTRVARCCQPRKNAPNSSLFRPRRRALRQEPGLRDDGRQLRSSALLPQGLLAQAFAPPDLIGPLSWDGAITRNGQIVPRV